MCFQGHFKGFKELFSSIQCKLDIKQEIEQIFKSIDLMLNFFKLQWTYLFFAEFVFVNKQRASNKI